MKLQSCLALLLLTGIFPASAQTYKAAKIVFKNAQMYPQAALENIAQIHPGTSFTAAELGNAAQRLADTGFFSDVGATLAPGRVDAITVVFTTKPVPLSDMIHVGFENFVWLTTAELQQAVRKKVPLFSGYIVEASPLVDAIDAALTEALAAKGITARVAHETYEPTMLRPERVLEYRIVSPRVTVANIKLAGVSPEVAPLLQKSVNDAAKFGYNDGLAGQSTADAVLSPLLNAGYAQARLSGVSVTPAVEGGQASVIVSATLSPGQIYKVAGLNFAGSSLLSAEDFSRSAKIHAGEVASQELLLETLEPIDSAYRRQGYMDVVVKTDPTFDDAAHTVSYSITIVPGEQYRVRDVTAENLDPSALAAFNEAFRMTKGELYNPEYVAGFLKNNSSVKKLEPYVAGYKAYSDPNTHTVDLVLTFARRAD